MPKRNLFDNDSATDLVYINTRAAQSDRAKACREQCEALWERFEPCADPEFVTEFGSDFSARYWEMYLAVALMDMGFEITCPKPGPDIGIMFEGRRIWFEATSPTRGEKGSPDEVPELQLGVVQDVPNDKMILRYLNSISSKKEQYDKWFKKDIILEGDALIIALNTNQLGFDYADTIPPRIVQVAFAVGDPRIIICRSTLKIVDSGFASRRSIPKAKGNAVRNGIFEDTEYNFLSGLLCSRIDVANQPERLGDDFQLLPNPNAAVPLPDTFRLRGTYFKVEITDKEYLIEPTRSNPVLASKGQASP